MGVIVYLKQVKSFGAGGYRARDCAACPTGKLICVSADGEVYCDHIPTWALIKKVSGKVWLMTCTPPEEGKDDS